MRTLTRIFIIALFSIIIMDASGQNVGFKVASSWTNAKLTPSDDGLDRKAQVAPKLGFIFEMPVYKGLFLQTGLYASLSGYRYKDTVSFTNDEGSTYDIESKNKYILLYLDLPVNFGYKHEIGDNLNVFGMLGPVFRYLTYSTHAFQINGEWDNESTSFGEGDNKKELFKDFDIGLNIEAGVQFDRFEFSIYYMPCFSNIYSDDVIEHADNGA
ncbi:MAG: hypothetical protein DRI83_06870, partial [Bacteroidetes bacterium]